MKKVIEKGVFAVRHRYIKKYIGFLRNTWYRFLGMKIGKHTWLPPIITTFPNQVSIGDRCLLEHNIYFKYAGVWQPGISIQIASHVFIGQGCEFNIKKFISIGNDCLIASGCKFIDHDHGVSSHELMRHQEGPEAPIMIGNNVWLGCNVIVLKGVSISDGAVVAAGAVVTKSILANEIWGGIPAKKIGERKP